MRSPVVRPRASYACAGRASGRATSARRPPKPGRRREPKAPRRPWSSSFSRTLLAAVAFDASPGRSRSPRPDPCPAAVGRQALREAATRTRCCRPAPTSGPAGFAAREPTPCAEVGVVGRPSFGWRTSQRRATRDRPTDQRSPLPSSERKRTRSSISARVRVSVNPSGMSDVLLGAFSSISFVGIAISLSWSSRSTSVVGVSRTRMPVSCRPRVVVTSMELYPSLMALLGWRSDSMR